MNIIDIIVKKKDKGKLTDSEIKFVVENFVNHNIKDYQMSSLLMAIVINGMDIDETVSLTKYMIESGSSLDLSLVDGITVDKHSTGGVGDKTTLILIPLLASLGFKMAKMSGRGLGHTGGTIDKLESISGYKVKLTGEEFINQVKTIGCAITSQTEDIAKADKLIYALRDVTGTTSSIPLIASSIMSKKIASGASIIIIDVKVGNGALMKTIEEARALAETMKEIGKRYDRKVVCILTNMNEPLGNKIGNGLEVVESIDLLKGKGPNDLKELVITLAGYVIQVTKGLDLESAKKEVEVHLNNDKAYDKFVELVTSQSGDINKIDIAKNKVEIKSNKEGYLKSINTYKLGEIAKLMGAGRETLEDQINYGVGLDLHKKIGDYINKDEVIVSLYVDKNIDYNLFNDVFEITSEKQESSKLIIDTIM